MSKYSAFYGRMSANGSSSNADRVADITKRRTHKLIMNSPTRRTVEHMELVEQADKTLVLMHKEDKPSIVSDKETFYKRTILWLPDEGVQLGSYLKYDDKIYLATNISDIDFYPQAYVDYCNHEIEIKGESERIIVEYDNLGRPHYKDYTPKFKIPVVITSKIYSVLDNSQMPLPEGAVILHVPYHEKVNIPVNYEFQFQGDNYQVTTVNMVNVLTDKDGNKYGYLEVRGQKDVKKP